MTDATRAFFLVPPEIGDYGAAGFTGQVGGALHPEPPPSILWGQGTPDGDLGPFTVVNKGSLYMSTNQTDDESTVFMKVDEGGDDNDWTRLLTQVYAVDHGACSDTGIDAHVNFDIDVTLSATDYFNAFDVALTMDGTSGAFATAGFFKITHPTTKAVSGYFCALELEAINTCVTTSNWCVLSLNSMNNGSRGSYEAFIKCNDYGSSEMQSLFYIPHHTIETTTPASMVSTATDQNATHNIRIVVGTTVMYLLATTTVPQ